MEDIYVEQLRLIQMEIQDVVAHLERLEDGCGKLRSYADTPIRKRISDLLEGELGFARVGLEGTAEDVADRILEVGG